MTETTGGVVMMIIRVFFSFFFGFRISQLRRVGIATYARATLQNKQRPAALLSEIWFMSPEKSRPSLRL